MKLVTNLIRFVRWFFGFGKKYRKREAEYARKSRKFGTSGELIFLFILAVVPVISLWGIFNPPSTILFIFSILGALLIFYVPKELLIIGIIALRHRAKMKIENKLTGKLVGKTAEAISGQELSENAKQDLDNFEAIGTANKYDLTVGLCGIILSALVIVAFVVILLLFISGAIQSLA